MGSQEMIPPVRTQGFFRQHWKRFVIGLSILLLFIIFTIAWIFSIGHLISGDWATILPIVFLVLGVAVALLMWLFPFSPIDTREPIALSPVQQDHSQPPVSPPFQESSEKPHSIWNIPYRRNPYFTGREQALQILHDRFKTGKTADLTQPQAISGLGGIGKTQIVIEYAYYYQNDYRYVLWVNAAEFNTIISSFFELATLLNLPQQQEQDYGKVVASVKHWFNTHDQWLAIFDNAEDLSLIEKYLPSTITGHILLTTRDQTLGTLANSLGITKMSKQEGTLFLLRRAKFLTTDKPLDQANPEDHTQAERIVELLDGLPLALDQAGAYIEATRCGLSNYFALYQSYHAELLKQRGNNIPNHPDSVTTTFLLSFEKIRKANRASAELLRSCAFLHPDDIPEEIMIEGSSRLGPTLKTIASNSFAFNEAIGELLRYSLIYRNSNDQVLTIHRLVQVILKDSLKKNIQSIWAKRVVQALHDTFPKVEFPTLWRCQKYIPHIQICSTLIDQWEMAFHEAYCLLSRAGNFFYEVEQYMEAESFYKQAISISEKTLGSNHHDVAVYLGNLANLYERQGKYTQAIATFSREQAIFEKIMGKRDLHVATMMSRLAWLYQNQGQYDQAEALYKQALTIFEKPEGSNQLAENRYGCMQDLAQLYRAQGKYSQARDLLETVLASQEHEKGSEDLNLTHTLRELALLFEDQHEFTQAEKLYLRALSIKEKLLGQNHPDVADSIDDLAWLYQSQGNYAKAELMLQQTLALREKLLGRNHSDVAISLDRLAHLYQHQSQYSKAQSYYQQALSIREQVLGTEHPIVAETLNHLAHCYNDQDNYAQAEYLFQRALMIQKKALGTEHIDVAKTLYCLASVYHKQGNRSEAEMLSRQALNIFEKKLEADHPQVIKTLDLLAKLSSYE